LKTEVLQLISFFKSLGVLFPAACGDKKLSFEGYPVRLRRGSSFSKFRIQNCVWTVFSFRYNLSVISDM